MSGKSVSSTNIDMSSVSEYDNNSVSSEESDKNPNKKDEPTEIYIDDVTFERNIKSLQTMKVSARKRNLLFSVLFHFTEKKQNFEHKMEINIKKRQIMGKKSNTYTAYFKNEYLQTLYTIIQKQCSIKHKEKEICKTYKTFSGDKLKLDMLSSFEKNLPDIDLYMKIEDLGTLHPSVVSLHYSKKGESTIETLDNDEFYKHIIENPEGYTIPPDAIKLIIVLYVDHLLKDTSNSAGGSNKTRRKRQKYKK